MVNNEENFVRADLLRLSQLELDQSGRAEPIAGAFSSRNRVYGCYAHAVCLGVIRTTRDGRALEDLPGRRGL